MRCVKLGLFSSVALVAAFAALVAAADATVGSAKRGTSAQRSATPATTTKPAQLAPLATFYRLLDNDERVARAALREISWTWQPSYAAILIQMMGWIEHRSVQADAVALLERASGRTFGKDANAMYVWLWSFDPGQHPDYSEFLATFFGDVDPRFREYFAAHPKSEIRLDEIRWGGVRRDGIPPLKNPKMIRASDATYLDDDNVVFGVALNGDVRAYPKRILAWHEMVKDKIGGIEINGVYCTLCGSMIVYDATVNGVHHELGTSGFLYRSNKLMYDHATKSMWSTLSGTPVVGQLVGQGIQLKPLYVVTTTWKEWRCRHPNTLVLSLDTGHRRDYGEGSAYREYFGTDRLMFNVPKVDDRLLNKAEVLALRSSGSPEEQLAIDAAFLAKTPVYHDRIGREAFVVLTDKSGANRVYATGAVSFADWDGDTVARDRQGRAWQVHEDGLAGLGNQKLARLPAHRAFWFGWYSQYPATRLVK
ncbi:MAG: DUF3179 domain-containing protein [Pseudomonadota bacterium]|nr:DUF3179 domain-containing protein [Pseudomonadota bacterium]